jgi:pyruvate,orthophosphate dikinase
MLGHRGVRLAITYPEIYEIQVRGIIEAACALKREGVDVHPEIMIPLVGMETELQELRALTEETAAKVCDEQGVHVAYSVGTMTSGIMISGRTSMPSRATCAAASPIACTWIS